jgi:hypothetical protein
LNGIRQHFVALRYNGRDQALGSCTPGAAGTMDVVHWVEGVVEHHHMVHTRDIQAARRDVSANEQLCAAMERFLVLVLLTTPAAAALGLFPTEDGHVSLPFPRVQASVVAQARQFIFCQRVLHCTAAVYSVAEHHMLSLEALGGHIDAHKASLDDIAQHH